MNSRRDTGFRSFIGLESSGSARPSSKASRHLRQKRRWRPASVVEVPYVFEGRTAGESKMNLKEATGYLKQLRDLKQFMNAQPPQHQKYQTVSPDAVQLLPREAVDRY
jgi:hypothetical protein